MLARDILAGTRDTLTVTRDSWCERHGYDPPGRN